MSNINLGKLLSVLLATFIVFSLLAVAKPLTVFACSCIPPGSPTEELEKSTAVFSGQVLNISREGYAYKVNFDVEKAWKGVSEKNIVVSTATEGSMCGFSFKEGERYIVYAHGDSSLSTGICSRTKLLTAASNDLSILGGSQIPSPQPNAPEVPSGKKLNLSQNWIFIIILVTIILGVIIYKVFLLRKKTS